jgi:hypothetical protein
VVREVVRDTNGGGGGAGVVSWPMLTKINYTEWAILMRVQLQGAGLWEAVDTDDATERQERQALGVILRSVPTEMVRVLAAKDNAKAAWDTIKTMRIGVDRVREARRQKLRKDFNKLVFLSGEMVEDFSLRVSSIITELKSLSDSTSELDSMQKILRVVPPRYAQMACSIETLLDLKQLSIEELSGHLAASEGRSEPKPETGGKLYLTEEEWLARATNRQPGSGGSGSGSKPAHKPKHDSRKTVRNTAYNTGKGERRKGNCRYCGKTGHWAKECRKAKRGHEQQQANLAQAAEEEAPALMMAIVTESKENQAIFLNEEKVIPMPSLDGLWYFNTGASSHMTGLRQVYATLVNTVHGTVKFGDGSVIKICGKGSIVFRGQTGE